MARKPKEGEVSHVCPPCKDCGEPPRMRGGTAVLVHKPGCRVALRDAVQSRLDDALADIEEAKGVDDYTEVQGRADALQEVLHLIDGVLTLCQITETTKECAS